MIKKVLRYNRTAFVVSVVMMAFSIIGLFTGFETPTAVGYSAALVIANMDIGVLVAERHTKV